MGVLDRFRNKPVSFLLEKKVGKHYETDTSFSTADYPRGPPTEEDLEEEMEDGVAYRLLAIFKDGNKKQVWRRGGEAAKAGKKITATDVKNYFAEATQPLKVLGESVKDMREVAEIFAGAFYGGGSEEGAAPAEKPQSLRDQLVQLGREYEDMRTAARTLLGTSLGAEGEGGIMGIPPPAFEGKLPWYMNPWVPKVMQYWSETAEAMAKSVTKGVKEAIMGEEKAEKEEEKVEVTLPSIELPPTPAEEPVAPPAIIELPEAPEEVAAEEERVVQLEKPKKKRSKKNE